MKKLILLVLLGILSITAHAGSGAGGIIEVQNKTNQLLDVNWGGVGCAGTVGGLTLACDREQVEPGRSKTYYYNWGVTTTWVTIALGESKGQHPCSYVRLGNEADCVINGEIVSTSGWDRTLCIIQENPSNPGKYGMNCTTYD